MLVLQIRLIDVVMIGAAICDRLKHAGGPEALPSVFLLADSLVDNPGCCYTRFTAQGFCPRFLSDVSAAGCRAGFLHQARLQKPFLFSGCDVGGLDVFERLGSVFLAREEVR